MSAASEAAALERAFGSGSANRRTGGQFAPPPPQPAPRPPENNGMYRQPPVQRVHPENLPSPPKPPPAPVPPPTPNGLGGKVSKAAAGLGNAAGRVAGAAAVVGTGAAFVKDPSLANGAKAIGTALLLLPNPYAQLAGFALYGLGELGNMFKSPENIRENPNIIPPPFTGGQGDGIFYNVTVRMHITNYAPTFDQITRTVRGKITGLKKTQNSSIQYWFITTSSGQDYGTWGGASDIAFCEITEIVRIDGQPDIDGNPSSGTENLPPTVSAANQDGWSASDFEGLRDQLEGIRAAIDNRNLSDSQKQGLTAVATQASPAANNGATPRAENRTPSPATIGDNSGNFSGVSITVLNGVGSPTANPDYRPNKSPFPTPDKNKAPQPEPAPETKPEVKPEVKPERFKEPSDCKFSCSALAECFSDLKVKIFDGCDTATGEAKTREITIQVLPKDKAKTTASFQELLDIRSRECTLNDKVLTVPEYWQIRVAQRSQAVVLYREFKDGKFTDSYYSLHIPHYTGNKNTKPNLTQYNKGESSAIYVCKDNSKLTVFAATEQEAKRIINQLEKYIDPKMKGEVVKFGTRKNIKKTTVKPIRLDFYSNGQTKLSPDWSIAL